MTGLPDGLQWLGVRPAIQPQSNHKGERKMNLFQLVEMIYIALVDMRARLQCGLQVEGWRCRVGSWGEKYLERWDPEMGDWVVVYLPANLAILRSRPTQNLKFWVEDNGDVLLA